MAITTIGGTIQSTAVTSNLDYKYGPYTDIQTANDALGPNGIDKIALGLTVGIIQQDNTIKEYWYQPNSLDELELVEKIPSSVFANPTEPATETIETIGIDGIVYSFPELTNSDLIEYNNLKTLRNNSELNPGKWYRITDYTCTTTQENTQSAGHVFDIIVHADSEDTLNENAFAIQHTGDTYFSNSKLSSWQIKYSLDNDTTRFMWADNTNGKGVIYYMKDEFNNEAFYDFKNILFKRWKVEDATTDSVLSSVKLLDNYPNCNISDFFIAWDINNPPIGTSAPSVEQSTFYYTFTYYDGNNVLDNSLNNEPIYNAVGDNSFVCQNNTVRNYSIYSEIDSVGYNILSLNNITFVCGVFNISGSSTSLQFSRFQTQNIIEYNCRFMTIIGECINNIFEGNSYENVLGGTCYKNRFGEKINENIILGSIENNSINKIDRNIITSNYFHFNKISHGFYENVISGSEFLNNTIDCEFNTNNILNTTFNYNTISNDSIEFSENEINYGNFKNNLTYGSFKNNTIGGKFTNNEIRDIINVTFGDEFDNNIIKVSMSSSNYSTINLIIGDNFRNNIIEDLISDNPIGDNFQNNIISSDFSGNNVGDNFKNNIIGDNFRGNTIGDNCLCNTIKSDFSNNTIGDTFTCNIIGFEFESNTVESDFSYNTVGNSFSNNNIVNENVGTNSGAFVESCNFFDNIKYIDFIGGVDSTRKVRNVQVWSNVHGTNQTQLTINPDVQDYSKIVSLKSDSTLLIWNPADVN